MIEDLLYSKNVGRVIEWFIIHDLWEQNQKDLCEFLKIYPKAMRKILQKLEDYEIIVPTKKIAKSVFYKANKKSELFIQFRILLTKVNNFAITKKYIET